MERIGVRELKERTSEIMRRVRDDNEMYEITLHGRVIARLVPVSEPAASLPPEDFWMEFDRVASAIGERWPEGVTAAGSVRGRCRDL